MLTGTEFGASEEAALDVVGTERIQLWGDGGFVMVEEWKRGKWVFIFRSHLNFFFWGGIIEFESSLLPHTRTRKNEYILY